MKNDTAKNIIENTIIPRAVMQIYNYYLHYEWAKQHNDNAGMVRAYAVLEENKALINSILGHPKYWGEVSHYCQMLLEHKTLSAVIDSKEYGQQMAVSIEDIRGRFKNKRENV